MQFKYAGEEPCEVFGLSWSKGTSHNVTDDHAIRKLKHHHLFEEVKGKAAKAEKSDVAPIES